MFKERRSLLLFILFFFIVATVVTYFLKLDKINPKIDEQRQEEELKITPAIQVTHTQGVISKKAEKSKDLVIIHNDKVHQPEMETIEIEKIEKNVMSNIQRYNDNLDNPEAKRQIEKETLALTEDYKKAVLKKVKEANNE